MAEGHETPSAGRRSAPSLTGRIASNIPGRVRVRLTTGQPSPQTLEAVASRLVRERGVLAATSNRLASSVTVQYDPHTVAPDAVPTMLAAGGIRIEQQQPGILERWRQRRSRQGRARRRGVLRVLDDLMVIFAPFVAAPEIPGGDEGGEERSLARAVQDLEDRIFLATGKRVRIATIGPLAVVGLGVVHIALFGLMIEAMPGILLLWIGMDTFVKLNPDLIYGPRLEQRVVDVLSLPDQERQIVTFVMRNELVTASELSAHTGLVEAALRAHLRKLVEEGYLVELTEDGETRYRPATSRRRGSSLSAELWQKIDAGEGTAPPAPPRRRRSQIPDDL